MKKIIFLLLLPVFLASCKRQDNNLIIACGMDEVFISDITYEVPRKIWSWTADSSSNLPASLRNKFLTTTECKPVNNSRDILVTSSGGGIALINIRSMDILFSASLPNARTAEILPGNYLAVAASLSPEGNRINIYALDKPPSTPIYTDSLYSASGLAWDDRLDLLWALGYDVLRAYSINENEAAGPLLLLKHEYKLPGRGVYDLQFIKDNESLCLTTEENVWIFDTTTKKFTRHGILGDEESVKSVTYNRETGRMAYVSTADDNWWAYYIRIAGTGRIIYQPYEKISKARWLY